jgi:hypothetical protein
VPGRPQLHSGLPHRTRRRCRRFAQTVVLEVQFGAWEGQWSHIRIAVYQPPECAALGRSHALIGLIDPVIESGRLTSTNHLQLWAHAETHRTEPLASRAGDARVGRSPRAVPPRESTTATAEASERGPMRSRCSSRSSKALARVPRTPLSSSRDCSSATHCAARRRTIELHGHPMLPPAVEHDARPWERGVTREHRTGSPTLRRAYERGFDSRVRRASDR